MNFDTIIYRQQGDDEQEDANRRGKARRVPCRPAGNDSFFKIKFKIPPFNGKYDPAAYLDCELEVEQKFSSHDIAATSQVKATVDAKCAPSAKHTASRTKLASHAQGITRRASQFFLKITKDKAVRYQSLELAGWYQTVPYLRLRSQMG
jgi:hypothetical protein